MRIVNIRQHTFALPSAQANASISFQSMTASAVAIVTDVRRDGRLIVGYGLDSAGRFGHGALAMERFAPRLMTALPERLVDPDGRNFDPDKIWSVMMQDEKPGGHGERAGAVGLLDMAIWDIVAKIEDKPLWRVLAERDGRDTDTLPRKVATYATGGYYRAADDASALREELRSIRDRGHTHVKIKAGGALLADDCRRIEAAIGAFGSADRVAIDLNGTLDLARADTFLSAVDGYGLRWVEEVGDPLDYDLQADIGRRYRTPFAMGENTFSLPDATNLIRYGGVRRDRDLLQFDVSLSYGLVEYRRILTMLGANGYARQQSFPHAGHVLSLHAVGGFGLGSHETGADPEGLFNGYPDGCVVEGGYVNLPDAPGLGIETTPNLYARVRSLAS